MRSLSYCCQAATEVLGFSSLPQCLSHFLLLSFKPSVPRSTRIFLLDIVIFLFRYVAFHQSSEIIDHSTAGVLWQSARLVKYPHLAYAELLVLMDWAKGLRLWLFPFHSVQLPYLHSRYFGLK